MELADDGNWYTSDGVPCSALGLPALRVKPRVSDVAQQAADKAWMDSTHEALQCLASTQPEITGDDVWAAITMPPRESRMIGNALTRARAKGLIERTDKHRPSTRPENHSRPVRVWKSLLYSQRRP